MVEQRVDGTINELTALHCLLMQVQVMTILYRMFYQPSIMYVI